MGSILGLEPSSVRKFLTKLKDKYKGVISIHTPGGAQTVKVISEHGLYKMLMQSRKPQAEKFQDWIAEEVVPSIRKKGSYTAGKTRIQMLQEMINEMAEQEQRVLAQEKRSVEQQIALESHESRLSSMEATQQAAMDDSMDIERASEEPAAKSTRSKLNQLVRAYCLATNANFQDVWNRIYTEFKYRYHTDLKVRAENRGVRPIEVADQLGNLSELLKVASLICRQGDLLPEEDPFSLE